jgi:rRNA maturation endonuclease Nob1
MDAPKNRVVLPCMHMCVCEACAQLFSDRCPVCRGPIERYRAVVHLNQRPGQGK